MLTSRSLLAVATCSLLVAGTNAGIYEKIFGASATICTDPTHLGASCNCPTNEERLYQGADCSSRGIGELPVGLQTPYDVPQVSFERNDLTVIKQRQFASNPAVETLRLSKNRLETVEPHAFSGLAGLQTLLLDKNRLTEIDPTAFEGLTKLRRLDLGFNQLRSLDPELFTSTDIRELQLHYNPLVKLDARTFFFLPRLQVLDLDSTDLADLPDGLFTSNQELVALHLPHNRLKAVPAAALEEATALSSLDLSGNQLETLPADSFAMVPSLHRLIISSMRTLRSVQAHAFSGLDQLEELLCQFNEQLTELDPAAFRSSATNEHLPRLVRVDLKECALTHISSDLLPWQRMEKVDLEMNQWNCDCQFDWVAKEEYLFENEPLFKCEQPESVAGRPVATLKAEEFVCENEGGSIALIVFLVLLGVAALAGIVFVLWRFKVCQKVKAKLSSRPKYSNVRTNKERVEVDGMEWDNKDIGV